MDYYEILASDDSEDEIANQTASTRRQMEEDKVKDLVFVNWEEKKIKEDMVLYEGELADIVKFSVGKFYRYVTDYSD